MFPFSDANPTRRRGLPYVNIALIVVNVAVFIYELTLGSAGQTTFFYKYGLLPDELAHGSDFVCYSPVTGGIGQAIDCERATGRLLLLGIETPFHTWGTVFTSMFLHGGILHIAGNMVFLWVFGDNVEDRLGHLAYLVFYLGSGVAAAWTQVAFDMNSDVPTIGASGAISGVLGAYLLLYPYNQVKTAIIFFFITVIKLPAVWVLGSWFLIQLLSGAGSLTEGVRTGGGVAYWAHIGGFAAGMLAIALLKLLVWRERMLPRAPRRSDYWRR